MKKNIAILLLMCLIVLWLPLVAQAGQLDGQSVQVEIDYAGAWVEVPDYGFQLYLPEGWSLVLSQDDATALTVQDLKAGYEMWVEVLPGGDLSMDSILDGFLATEGFDEVQALYINDLSFVHYLHSESNVRGYATLFDGGKQALLFKFSPGDDEALTRYAEQIMSSLKAIGKNDSGSKVKNKSGGSAKNNGGSSTNNSGNQGQNSASTAVPPAPTAVPAHMAVVATWADFTAAAAAGKTEVRITGNIRREGAEETVVFTNTVAISSGDGTKYQIDGNGKQIVRIESGGGSSTLSNLTFTGGNADGAWVTSASRGGALFSDGDVTATDCTFSDNVSRAYGGAVYVKGDLTITGDSKVENNTTDAFGGGACAEGSITLSGNTVISGNETLSTEGLGGSGGGVFASGDVTVSGEVTITNNVTGGEGGGVCSNGDVTISGNVVISENTGARGGGVFTTGDVAISDNVVIRENEVVLDGNTGGYGGGVYAFGDVTLADHAAIIENSALNHGGGVFSIGFVELSDNAKVSDNTAGGNGGGIHGFYDVRLSGDAQVSGNAAGGNGGGVAMDGSALGGVGSVIDPNGGITGNTPEDVAVVPAP